MSNTVMLVGRIVNDPTLERNEDKKYSLITVAVTRSFKNVEGVYETDFIPVVLWKGIAEQTCEWCKKGDLIGIKGRLQMEEDKIEIIAEKVTFLSSKREEE